MDTDFTRTRIEIAGFGVTITSWYEPEKRRFRAHAPAFGHLLADSGSEEASNKGTTREGAIRAVTGWLFRCLTEPKERLRAH